VAAGGIVLRHLRIEEGAPLKRRIRTARILKRNPIEKGFVLVPSMCHHEVIPAKRCTDRPVIFDPLISRYLTKIHDYGLAGRKSFKAALNFRVDKQSLNLADFVLADTLAHKDYYVSTFGVPEAKIVPLYIGCNTDDFFPQDRSANDVFRVGFYGSFNPLQGIHIIVEAARILKDRRDIRFEIVGEGFTYNDVVSLARSHNLENISFLGRKPYRNLCGLINTWDICLGIFGETLKAQLVIPNKVYHYAACRKAVITMDTTAVREIFSPEKDIHLTGGRPEDLAEAVLLLHNDQKLREKLASNAHRTINSNYSHIHIGRKFRSYLNQWA
jgi:glycosyltransferase involved in cell wall biosynthesis